MAFQTIAKEKPEFLVLSVDTAGFQKMSLDIEASRRLDESELRSLAREIYKNVRGYEYGQFFMTWYLPGMIPGSGAWATTHFTPRLTVKIMDWMLEYNPPAEQYSHPAAP